MGRELSQLYLTNLIDLSGHGDLDPGDAADADQIRSLVKAAKAHIDVAVA